MFFRYLKYDHNTNYPHELPMDFQGATFDSNFETKILIGSLTGSEPDMTISAHDSVCLVVLAQDSLASDQALSFIIRLLLFKF